MNNYAAAYRKAAKHLLALGLCPAPFRDELQALWANNSEDRELVQEISERWISS